MEVITVLRMNGGTGDTSYANNSHVQKKVISMTKPIVEEAITDLYYNNIPKSTISIADLGCSSGPNTLLVVSELIKVVDNIRVKEGRQSPEFQVYLNDLPGNDFNSIFWSLPSFQENLKKQMGSGFGPCFFYGIPGSFYHRLFATKSLHFVHSSYSLQWLSQVPVMAETNKGNIYITSTSPQSVIKAYYDQFQTDFSTFLKCRSDEIVTGGSMVLTILGRKSDDPTSKECCYIWELLSMVLNDLVLEGLIEEDKLDTFNVPVYKPSPKEIRSEVEKEGSFVVNRLEVSRVNWSACNSEFYTSNAFKDDAYKVAQCMRAVSEPLLVAQFGEAIIDEVFQKYRDIIADRMSKEKTELINVTVSLTRK